MKEDFTQKEFEQVYPKGYTPFGKLQREVTEMEKLKAEIIIKGSWLLAMQSYIGAV